MVEEKDRIDILDLLRGLFIILALEQHFIGYINVWYQEYFTETAATSTFYKSHATMLGQAVKVDGILLLIGELFTPWVSQIYLFMAAFNIALRRPHKLKDVLLQKVKVLLGIFIIFAAENLIVSPNAGQGFSIYPIHLWMFILALLICTYTYFGIKGVFFIFILSLMRFLTPIDNWSSEFQQFMTTNFHPDFEYDARIEYFLSAGCLGLILGHCYFIFTEINKKMRFLTSTIILGIIAVIVIQGIGIKFNVDPYDHLSTEHSLAQNFPGCVYILGMLILVVSSALMIENIVKHSTKSQTVKIKLPIISWVGRNSLLVFGIHRIVFVKLIMPLYLIYLNIKSESLSAGFVEIYFFILITIGVAYLLQKKIKGEPVGY